MDNEMSELEKISKYTNDIRILHEFLEWLQGKKSVEFGKWNGDRFIPALLGSDETLIYEFFSIDAEQLEKERKDLLDSVEGS